MNCFWISLSIGTNETTYNIMNCLILKMDSDPEKVLIREIYEITLIYDSH